MSMTCSLPQKTIEIKYFFPFLNRLESNNRENFAAVY